MNEGFFAPDRTLLENLAALSERQATLTEQRICELAELALSMAEATERIRAVGMDMSGCLSLLSDLSASRRETIRLPDDAVPINRERLALFSSVLSLYDRVALCGLYLEKLADRRLSPVEADFLPEKRGGTSVCYVRNPLSDEAFDVFSETLSGARVHYVSGLDESCRAVAEGKSDFCLLPLEERGTRLARVSALLYRYDLKIDEVTPVFGFAGDADMKYALLSRGFRTPRVQDEDDRYFEMRIPFDPLHSSELSELLYAAGGFGYSLYRINTQILPDEAGERPICSIVFCDEGKDFLPLLVYLLLFVPDFTAVGIYRNLQ